MALSGRGNRRSTADTIWPGFVDAMTTMLLVVMFLLTIFTVVQAVLREKITSQDGELNQLTLEIASLADALGMERVRAADLEGRVSQLSNDLTAAQSDGAEKAFIIASLSATLAVSEDDLTQASMRIASFEEQVATLLASRAQDRGAILALKADIEALDDAKSREFTRAEALALTLAQARDEINQQEEQARLAAARRQALDFLIADLRRRNINLSQDYSEATTVLSEEQMARLVDQAALQALRDKLKNSDAELTALTLDLEEQRRKAEETLTLLAAAQTKMAQDASSNLPNLLAVAQEALSQEQNKSFGAQREVALLNQQVVSLRGQMASLQNLLDAAAVKDELAGVQLDALGSKLNSALAQVAADQKRRAELESAERKRLEAETKSLAKYRSEFFGQLSQLLEGRDGVRVVGDRFIFSSEVLFEQGAADLAAEGKSQIAGVVAILNEIAGQIPLDVDWIIRVDGHTDNVPLSNRVSFKDNWELSQARALSVVRFMQDDLGFPPDHMAATGFGEYRPVALGDSDEARAQNRRIELKLTER
ncbi:MAG TPA: peptidoglycan-binding protein [Rhodobacter sp.]|jgi:chemotaxis protein MotB|nr:peptidoglycan -binding protein [Paracoccaceae bacterium]HAQ47102.1 peptidoglycan-binding protein [Rhodobacter sp.]